MSLGGWIFMAGAWTAATALVTWCYVRLLGSDFRDRR